MAPPLADTTNAPAAEPDALAVALDDVGKLRAEIESMKSLVAGFTKPKKARKRKRQTARWSCFPLFAYEAVTNHVVTSPSTDDENDSPATNKAKTIPPEHSQNFESHGRIVMRFIGPFENIEDVITHGLKGDTALPGDEIEEKYVILTRIPLD